MQCSTTIDNRYPTGLSTAPIALRTMSPCSPPSPTSCNMSWSALRGKRDLSHDDRCLSFSDRASSDTTKWVEPPISTRLVGQVSASGNDNGTGHFHARNGTGRQPDAVRLSGKNKIGILAGSFTKRFSGTGVGRTRSVTRYSFLGRGQDRRAPGNRSATDCSTRTATTYMSPNSTSGGT